MTNESELEYLQRRAAEELACADVATDAIAAEVHLRMGLLYSNRAAELCNQQDMEIVPPTAVAL